MPADSSQAARFWRASVGRPAQGSFRNTGSAEAAHVTRALRVRSADCVRGWLHDVDDREARVDIEAGGREERGAEVTGEE